MGIYCCKAHRADPEPYGRQALEVCNLILPFSIYDKIPRNIIYETIPPSIIYRTRPPCWFSNKCPCSCHNNGVCYFSNECLHY